ncbi:unnamed protein product [Cuscuta campestris]|uniref:Myb/SANT-like domain-containing protein n=1 Tax=Cuscuta campestris TaxID=132261 RepID=A0A484NKI5_9ASTE|nr:unnamed protein product [Cuscuta campestris]
MTEAAQLVQKWMPEEECVLVLAWVDVSEHPIVGSEQTKDAMWDHIEKKFFMAMNKDASYRTRDQLTSKWGHMTVKSESLSEFTRNAPSFEGAGRTTPMFSGLPWPGIKTTGTKAR